MIVGVSGSYCAGKDTAAQYLETKGFSHFSLSDILRAELRTRHQEVNRENLITLGNELREKFGNGALAFFAVEGIESTTKYVVSSIRHPIEVEVLKRRGNFVFLYIDAPAEIRFERMRARNKSGEEFATLEDFLASEQRESGSSTAGQQLHKMKALADIIIPNTSTPEEFQKSLDAFVNEWQPKLYKRPDLDDYFLGMARYVGKRGTCDRGKAGAVIVRKRHVLSTGYVGAPVNQPHCDEAGHEFQTILYPDGTTSKHCIRSVHAEQNAIIQAAQHGASTEDATLYCKMEPCYTCAKMIVNAGIKRVVVERRYHGAKRTRDILGDAKIDLVVKYDELEKYAGQK